MSDILREIFENKKKELQRTKEKTPLHELTKAAKTAGPLRNFLTAFCGGKTSIIAEIKFNSPSNKGTKFKGKTNVAGMARIYKVGGASALSVLTEEKYFSGDIDYLIEARNAADLPILRKDFIFDPYQIYEARAFGADAYLLIADYLRREEISELLETGKTLGLEALVEIHSEESFQKIIGLPFNLLGINNRDLRTLKIDVNTTFSILEKYTGELNDKIIISESGIKSREEILQLGKKGVRGFLIGTAFMNSDNPEQKLKELMG